jgi:hypothetical protein
MRRRKAFVALTRGSLRTAYFFFLTEESRYAVRRQLLACGGMPSSVFRARSGFFAFSDNEHNRMASAELTPSLAADATKAGPMMSFISAANRCTSVRPQDDVV